MKSVVTAQRQRYACAVYAVVCPSIHLSHAGIVPKRINLGSCKQLTLVFWCHKSTQNSSRDAGTPNSRLKQRFSINILLYLRNGAR